MVTYTPADIGHLIPIIQSYQDELVIKCPIEYLQVYRWPTTLVFLLFIYMIPIDRKITNFSLYLYTYSTVWWMFTNNWLSAMQGMQ